MTATTPAVRGDLEALREALDKVGYTVDALGDLLRNDGSLSARRTDREIYRRRLAAQPGPLADVVTLLAMGWDVPADRVTAALGKPAFAALLESGAVVVEGSTASATIRLVPSIDLWIASDAPYDPAERGDPLYVTGINSPAALLASLTVRRKVATALDLGTGNGIQALVCAADTEHVVATDINPRALAYARFNAALNGVDNIEFREGSLFEPVDGERFDLVVSNPPYVISPASDYVYRDSGREPAALCREIVGTMPRHLTDCGYGAVLVSWPMKAGDDWAEVLHEWLAPGADSWLIHLHTNEPLGHAARWNLDLDTDLTTYTTEVDRWAGYYRDQGIEQIGFGAVLLRGTDGDGTVIRADDAKAVEGSATERIQRAFSAHDFLRDRPDIADLRIQLVSGHRFTQSLVCSDGGWELAAAELEVSGGLAFSVRLDAVMAQVLVALDGTRTVREAVRATMPVIGIGEDSLPDFLDATSRMVRGLLTLGIAAVMA
ncbi:methyltransferase [Fodinicola acaciae]|uniref:methyltransferase n=1 Tax=Fodinicola acaciae TaxID=2681555 RepID=UPI0013D84DCA|nr:methyltransferase [Fodinicola acaciae]